MPDIHARLQAGPSRIADLGVGLGWSSIALARAYPMAEVHGFDLDTASVNAAQENAQSVGLTQRVTFLVKNAGDPELAGQYDLALAIECVHDMSNPVEALSAMRRLVGPGGTVLIVDEKVAPSFAAPGDDVERLNYGFSVLHCLPIAMVDRPTAATGAVIREDIMRRYVAEAGYAEVEVLPVSHDFFRFYRLTA